MDGFHYQGFGALPDTAFLAQVRSGAVSDLRWKLILEKGKENWFNPSRISCDECTVRALTVHQGRLL